MKNKRGITLIALVITIIILLILAGVTILQLTQNGLFEDVKEAKRRYENAQSKEKDVITDYETLLGQYISNSRDTITISIEELTELIDARIEKSANPTGSIIAQMGVNAPDGYLSCDGSIYNINEYNNLADYIKEQFGSYDYWGGDGTTTFAVPNLQGEFLRGTGTNNNSNQGNGAAVGKHQDGTLFPYYRNLIKSNGLVQFRSNEENVSPANMDYTHKGTYFMNINASQKGDDSSFLDFNQSSFTSRPTNTSVLYCIKY